jgi:poly-beta-1,6-N-acetyl-D-glucosamine biosynthesis protein PgaD
MKRRKPNDENGLQRAAEFTVTTLFWLAWLYLIMPLVSLLLWIAGVQLFVDEMIIRGGLQALIEDLLRYGLVVLSMLIVTVVWVTWNLRHYGGHNKRTHQPQPVSLEELAADSELAIKSITEIQSVRRMLITFDADDHPVIRELGSKKSIQ